MAGSRRRRPPTIVTRHSSVSGAWRRSMARPIRPAAPRCRETSVSLAASATCPWAIASAPAILRWASGRRGTSAGDGTVAWSMTRSAVASQYWQPPEYRRESSARRACHGDDVCCRGRPHTMEQPANGRAVPTNGDCPARQGASKARLDGGGGEHAWPSCRQGRGCPLGASCSPTSRAARASGSSGRRRCDRHSCATMPLSMGKQRAKHTPSWRQNRPDPTAGEPVLGYRWRYAPSRRAGSRPPPSVVPRLHRQTAYQNGLRARPAPTHASLPAGPPSSLRRAARRRNWSLARGRATSDASSASSGPRRARAAGPPAARPQEALRRPGQQQLQCLVVLRSVCVRRHDLVVSSLARYHAACLASGWWAGAPGTTPPRCVMGEGALRVDGDWASR